MEQPGLLSLSKIQRISLLIASFLLATTLFLMRAGMNSEKPLDFLARSSLEPEIALENGHPTIIEFYADWCEICQEMAPALLKIKGKYDNKIDIVLLNVDNQKWLDLIEKYEVNGIPQLNLFDKDGVMQDKLVGLHGLDDLSNIIELLLNNQKLPTLASMNNLNSSKISTPYINQETNLTKVSPRSHG